MTQPSVVRLSDLAVGQDAVCFAQLSDRARNTTKDGKPFFVCRFRDARKSLGTVIWGDAPLFADCEVAWEVGRCYKLRVNLIKTDKYGEQIVISRIRLATNDDRSAGYDPGELVETSRFDREAMFKDLRELAETNVADVPLRTLVLKLLDENKSALELLPGSLKHYHLFAGGWLEHTLAVTQTCLQLEQRYRAHYPELSPAIHWAKIDRVVFGATIADAESAGFAELTIAAKDMARMGGSPLKVESGLLAKECAALFEEWKKAGGRSY